MRWRTYCIAWICGDNDDKDPNADHRSRMVILISSHQSMPIRIDRNPTFLGLLAIGSYIIATCSYTLSTSSTVATVQVQYLYSVDWTCTWILYGVASRSDHFSNYSKLVTLMNLAICFLTNVLYAVLVPVSLTTVLWYLLPF